MSGAPHVGQVLSVWTQHLAQNAVPHEQPRAVAVSSTAAHAAQTARSLAPLRPLPCRPRPWGVWERPRADSLDDMCGKPRCGVVKKKKKRKERERRVKTKKERERENAATRSVSRESER